MSILQIYKKFNDNKIKARFLLYKNQNKFLLNKLN